MDTNLYTEIHANELKSLNTVLDLYLHTLLFVKLVFRAKLQVFIFPPFYKGIISLTFHQY